MDGASGAVMRCRWAWLNWPAGIRRVLAALFWMLVTVLLFLPSDNFHDVEMLFPQQDKVAHLGMIGTLAALIRWSIPDSWGRGWRGGVVVMVLMAYGLGTECLQPLIPGSGRSFEWADILMDGIGVVLGTWLCGRLAVSGEGARVQGSGFPNP